MLDYIQTSFYFSIVEIVVQVAFFFLSVLVYGNIL